MNLEAQYRQALELTHQMLVCAKTQDWERLSHLGQLRATLVEQAATHRAILALAEELLPLKKKNGGFILTAIKSEIFLDMQKGYCR